MKNKRFLLALILFLAGMAGILSLLSLEVNKEQLPPEVLAMYSERVIQLLVLVNPTLLLILALVAGTLLHERTRLSVPLMGSMIGREPWWPVLRSQLSWGIPLGIFTGVFIWAFARVSRQVLPEEFLELSQQFEPTVLMKLLYGGITEELLVRFGLMTLVVWLISLATKSLSSGVYWAAIVLTSVLFGAGHLGVLFNAVAAPSAGMILYVIVGNSVAGIFLGWLYWKKGLEAAIFAHMTAHLAMIFLLHVVG